MALQLGDGRLKSELFQSLPGCFYSPCNGQDMSLSGHHTWRALEVATFRARNRGEHDRKMVKSLGNFSILPCGVPR